MTLIGQGQTIWGSLRRWVFGPVLGVLLAATIQCSFPVNEFQPGHDASASDDGGGVDTTDLPPHVRPVIAECASQPRQLACWQCCRAALPGSYDAYWVSAGPCICRDESGCSACRRFCDSKGEADDNCVSCAQRLSLPDTGCHKDVGVSSSPQYYFARCIGFCPPL